MYCLPVTDLVFPRNRIAPYPAPTSPPVTLHESENPVHGPEDSGRSVNPSDARRPNAGSNTGRLANRKVISGSGSVYTLLPCDSPTQAFDEPSTNTNRARPRPPHPQRPNQTTDTQVHENSSPSNGSDVVQETATIVEEPPTTEDDTPAPANIKNALPVAKGFVKEYGKIGRNVAIESETDENVRG